YDVPARSRDLQPGCRADRGGAADLFSDCPAAERLTNGPYLSAVLRRAVSVRLLAHDAPASTAPSGDVGAAGRVQSRDAGDESSPVWHRDFCPADSVERAVSADA